MRVFQCAKATYSFTVAFISFKRSVLTSNFGRSTGDENEKNHHHLYGAKLYKA